MFIEDISQGLISEDKLGVFDEVEAVSSLNNGVDPGVESCQKVEAVLESVRGLVVVPEVGGLLWEEVGSESLVGVQKHSVDVVVELGGHVLGGELNLVDVVTSLGSLGGGRLSGLSVPESDGVVDISWLNLGDVEAGSEGVGAGVWGVEEIVERSGLQVLMLLVNLGQHDWGDAEWSLQHVSLGLWVVLDLAQGGSQLGGGDEGHDVGVVLEHQDLLLGSLVVGGGSNSHNGSLSQVWELELEGQSVEGLTGGISELELVRVGVQPIAVPSVHFQDCEACGLHFYI